MQRTTCLSTTGIISTDQTSEFSFYQQGSPAIWSLGIFWVKGSQDISCLTSSQNGST